MIEPTQITPEMIQSHGITEEEYQHILEILGREPTFTELGIFSVMWSEHCSYKNSRPILKLFPTTGPKVIVKAGDENAGVIDIGDGLGVCFKVESHNHPSAIEPFQGAATGVGGILRDIFTMGARPLAIMNSLRFGDLAKANVKRLLSGVVAGIAHYGNCIGVPTVGGEVYFDSSYEGNPLVNVMCLGLVKNDEIAKGAAKGIGNPVFYVGATTGRDGLGGASFASKELTEESEQDRPAVQVGDPFMEKLLLEACLEILQTDAVVGIQDMGAAGLTCSCCETASRGGNGVEIELDLVPKRETGMIPYEIMLSESQERMLIIVDKDKKQTVIDIFDKWGLHAAEIGKVTDDGFMTVKHHGEVVAQIPAAKIADDAPIYYRESEKPKYLEQTSAFDTGSVKEPADFNKVFTKLITSPSIASKNWVYEQYDHMVRTNTEVLPGSDAAVIRIKENGKRLAMSIDGNGRYCHLDPYEGGKTVVAEAARNVVCTGGRPVGVTDCLNFGNPMDPEVFWQFKECAKGITDACNAFELPVTGGNVSLYNESPKGAIFPTPTVGVVGIVEKETKCQTQYFKKPGDAIVVLGETYDEIGASEYLSLEHGTTSGLPPRLDLEKENKLYEATIELIEKGVINSAHDCSEGGLSVCIAESCISGPKVLGARINFINDAGLRTDSIAFGESQSRIVVSLPAGKMDQLASIADDCGVVFQALGTVEAAPVFEFAVDSKTIISKDTNEIKTDWTTSLETNLKQ